MAQRSRFSIAAAVLLAGALAAIVFQAQQTSAVAVFDDAYMFVRYADHLLSGKGFAWNPDGLQTYGATSIPYLLCVSLLRAATEASAKTLLRSLSFGLGLLSIALMGLAARRHITTPELKHPASILALLLLVVLPFPALIGYTSDPTDALARPHPRFVIEDSIVLSNALTGMDTLLAMAINIVLIHVVLRSRGRGGSDAGAIGFASGLTVLVRPDNGLTAVLFPLLFFALVNRERRLAPYVKFCAVFAAVLGLDLAWKTLVFGSPLPLPLLVKSTNHYEAFVGLSRWNGLMFSQNFLSSTLGLLAISIGVCSAGTRRIAAAFFAPAAAFLVWTLLGTVQFMGYFGRFYAPLIPFVFFGAAMMLDEHVRLNGRSVRRLVGAAAFGGVTAVIFWLGWSLAAMRHGEVLAAREATALQAQPEPWPQTPTTPRYTWKEGVTAMSRFAAGLPSTVSIAGTEHGYLGALDPERTIVDLTGLNDPEFARFGFSVERLLARAPDIVWMPEFIYLGMRREIAASSSFLERYEIHPGLFRFGLAVRKDSPAKASIDALIAAETARRTAQQ